jgi:hypothetical protein
MFVFNMVAVLSPIVCLEEAIRDGAREPTNFHCAVGWTSKVFDVVLLV